MKFNASFFGALALLCAGCDDGRVLVRVGPSDSGWYVPRQYIPRDPNYYHDHRYGKWYVPPYHYYQQEGPRPYDIPQQGVRGGYYFPPSQGGNYFVVPSQPIAPQPVPMWRGVP
jgi:hypothetical protein